MKRDQNYIRYITFLAAFGALAYLSAVFLKIPMISFLKYEPKDVILILGGIVFGPIFSIILSIIVPFFEMITVSSTGIIGFVMNVIAAICFVLPPVLAYSKKKKTKNLIIGLIIGIVMLTAFMLLWNYVLSPIFFGYSRAAVVKMLIPVILPFNLIKGSLNSILVLILYKPIVQALLKSNILRTSDFNIIPQENKLTNYAIVVLVIITIILLVLSYLKLI
ncbi:ECF transporter S component [Lactobacillus sp. W8089]|nr:ECF transporter S component [Lactobacillus sp. W8086]MBI0108353.1 ECF transporter S component [Lactobacillus sp. W8085]MBI0111571.1 ECF transporter S component [Lactobacillus sp. W8088]MBI0115286.1 ECF transporter S component [Lactobacillus sp. W8087]MBI0119011.1 ECF transporter S component [Lactobacillus sp. W8089]MBI0130976.1 ECF transporter S component [Lactobacillus sp. W8090]